MNLEHAKELVRQFGIAQSTMVDVGLYGESLFVGQRNALPASLAEMRKAFFRIVEYMAQMPQNDEARKIIVEAYAALDCFPEAPQYIRLLELHNILATTTLLDPQFFHLALEFKNLTGCMNRMERITELEDYFEEQISNPTIEYEHLDSLMFQAVSELSKESAEVVVKKADELKNKRDMGYNRDIKTSEA